MTEIVYPSLDRSSIRETPVSTATFRKGTLFTSLPPKLNRQSLGCDVGESYQKACIESWRRAGFDIVSVNSREEIERLATRELNIRFVESAHTPPRIGDMLSAARTDDSDIVGIINADCIIFAPDGIIDSMIGAALEGIAMAERMNLDPTNLSVTGVSCSGFDLFLFGKWMIPAQNFDDEITIGTPWWDYWFPVHHVQEGGKLFLAETPILLHLDHAVKWNQDTYTAQRRRFHDSIAADESAVTKVPFIKYNGPVSEEELGSLGAATFDWLQSAATKIGASDEYSNFLSKFLSALNQPPALVESSENGTARVPESDRLQGDGHSNLGQILPAKFALEVGKFFCTIGLKRIGAKLYNEASSRLGEKRQNV